MKPCPDKPVVSKSRHQIEVAPPYRLDLTVSVLRRLPTNNVDILTADGEYVRVLHGPGKGVLVRVVQKRSGALAVTLEGCADLSERRRALTSVRRILGVGQELSHFYNAAKGVPWLWPLAVDMRGVKPPRYPSLWESCVNAIVFQQVSLIAASSITKRLVLELGSPVQYGNITLYAFPSAEALHAADDGRLLATGLSANKLAALRRVSAALLDGSLTEAMLEERSSEDAAALLCGIKGIGPWTATLILLRGMGRLDVFPGNDSSVARNLAMIAGDDYLDVETKVPTLGLQRGMLYYHLLLARLQARGEIGRPSLT